MSVTRTKLELNNVYIDHCPECGALPLIGYSPLDDKPWRCGCTSCGSYKTIERTIGAAVNGWNIWAQKIALEKREEWERQEQMEAEQ